MNDEKPKEIIITYSFSDYEKLMNYYEKKGIAFGLFVSSIFTLVFLAFEDIECYACTVYTLVCLLFVFALTYKIYSHYLSKKLTIAEVEEV